MFVYFDNQGTLKEIVNDSAIRQGNYGVDKIYFFIEGGEIVDGVHKALDFAAGRRTFTDVSGNTLTTESFSLTTTTLEIPFNKKRELKWFKYWTNYEFFVIDLPSEVLVNHGTVGCRIEMIENDTMEVELTEEDILTAHPALTLGWLIFNVEQTATGAIIEPDTAINIAQWNYLIHNMVTMADLDTAVDGKQDELVSGENIKTINGESILGSGNLEIESGMTVPVFDAEITIEEETDELDDIKIGQNDLNDIFENKYPIVQFNITKITIESRGSTQEIEIPDGNMVFQFTIDSKMKDVDSDASAISYVSNSEDEDDDRRDYIKCLHFTIVKSYDETGDAQIVSVGELKAYTNLAEVAYTGDYNDLNGKPDIPVHTSQLDNDSGYITSSDLPNVATELTQSSTDNEVVGAKCAYDEIQNVREVAEGRCKTYILNDYAPVIDSNSEARKYKKADGTYFTDLADFNDYIGSNNPTCINNLFNSQNAAISIFEIESYDYYLIESDTKTVYSSYAGGVGGNDFWKFNKGDEFLIIQTNVPDRWFSVQSGSEGGGILLPDSFVFHVLETKTQDLSNYAQKSDVPAVQATATVVKDALTNINGRVLSAYEATVGFDQDYVWYTITYGGQPVTEEQAINYMEYMTGSRFLPIYDYEKPQNCVFIFGDRSVWKPQYDTTNGLKLYRISTSLAAEDTDNDFTGNNTFNGSLGGRLIATYNEFSLTNNDAGIWLSDALYLKDAEINLQGNVVINGSYAEPDVGLHFYDQPMGHAYYFNINDNDETLDIIVSNGIGAQATNVTVASIDGGTSKFYFYEAIFDQDLLVNIDDNYDIGASNKRWKDLYLSGSIDFKDSSGNSNRTWRIRESQWGTIEFVTSNDGGANWSNRFSMQTSAFCPTIANTVDLGTSNVNQKWKDFYFSGDIKNTNYTITWDNGIKFQNSSNVTLFYIGSDKSMWFYGKLMPSGTPDIGDSTHTVKDIYTTGKIYYINNSNAEPAFDFTNGYISLERNMYFHGSDAIPQGNCQLGSSSNKWKYLYVENISDGLGNTVTPEQLYYLGKAIQGLAQPVAVNLSNGDTLTDQPTIYMMAQHLPVMINSSMCYFLTEDTNYYVYTSHYFDSSTLDVVPYKIIVNKSTFVVTIARI